MRNDVRERRLERGLSQAELARTLDVSRQTINSIETGKYTRIDPFGSLVSEPALFWISA